MMEPIARKRGMPVWVGLTVLYVVFVLLRILLAFVCSSELRVMPDETLYFNLARSLFTEGSVAMRGQPITYDSLLYPIFLSPLLVLPQRVDMYRAIQVVNALALHLCIFPAWALARRITSRNTAAWAVVLLTLLLPDLSANRFALAENIAFPLILLALWLALRAFDSQRVVDVLLVTGVAFLLYVLKPGYVALFIGFLLCLAVGWLHKRGMSGLYRLLAAVGLYVAALVAWRLLTQYALGVDHSFVSLYGSQMQPFSLSHLLKTASGVLLYLYFIPVACLVFPLVVPIAHGNALREEDRPLLWMTLLSMLITVVGTAYIIYVDEYTGSAFSSRIHLRYIAPYIPALLAFGFSPLLTGKRMNGPLFAMLAFVLAGTAVFSLEGIVGGPGTPIDALTLSAITYTGDPQDGLRAFFTLLLVFGVLCGAYALFREGWSERMRRCVLIAFAVFSLLNNAATYASQRASVNGGAVMADARQANAMTAGSQVVGVVDDGAYLLTSAACLDVHSRKPMAIVELDDIMANTGAGGVYTPFVPRSYWQTDARNSTPQAEWIVLDAWANAKIIPAAQERVRDVGSGSYRLIHVGDATPWIHSAISGMDSGRVQEGTVLSVFDAALCAQPSIAVELSVRSAQEGALLTLTAGTYEHTQTLSAGWQQLTLDIPTSGADVLRLYLSTGQEVYLDGFAVEGNAPGF